ncbi:MAG: hypothetical protein V3S24_15960, partial [Candidatus Tectomicrobia bacterium]
TLPHPELHVQITLSRATTCARRSGRPPLRAGDATIAARKRQPLAEAGGGSRGAKMALVFPIRVTLPQPRWDCRRRASEMCAPGGVARKSGFELPILLTK